MWRHPVELEVGDASLQPDVRHVAVKLWEVVLGRFGVVVARVVVIDPYSSLAFFRKHNGLYTGDTLTNIVLYIDRAPLLQLCRCVVLFSLPVNRISSDDCTVFPPELKSRAPAVCIQKSI